MGPTQGEYPQSPSSLRSEQSSFNFFVGMSNLEIAATLGRTEGAVKALQHRAIHRLQSILANERPGISSALGIQELA